MSRIIQLKVMLEKYRNRENAIQMEKYMKNHFPFLGIKTPIRRKVSNIFFRESNILKEDFQPDFVMELWELDEREYQNIALDYIERSLQKIGKEQLPFFEKLITTKSWWDTVDMLAQKPVGKIAKDHPSVIEATIDGWSEGQNLWLRRSAILYQLKFKAETDENKLSQYIKQNASSNEFFIQKAIGWSLREYSKTNPRFVKQFIEENNLPKISIREGSKYIS
ncbi:DNA alkylation repair protein [Ornithinibacillus sp. L9]|uniref:DNA alkylation repair protein n=1 Tax=Ornithinibacillus caprae TaxID=2678566 RepID=A0A6N8FPT9_9BACI|nr:DNA alkylation repair protein [Ornithinibacillus caprae]MUK90714.1 DNA alkylation repair protein [Ornithinibacillus caprae]